MQQDVGHHGGHAGGLEGVVMDPDPVAGDVGAVLSVPAAVHVEAVAIGVFEDDVVACLVTRARPARAGDVVAAVVEQIRLDQCLRLIQTHAVAQPGPLIVVHVIVVDVCPGGALAKEDSRVRPAGQLAVVNLQALVVALYAARVGDAVVLALSVELTHLLGAALAVRPAEAQAGDADAVAADGRDPPRA